MTEKAAHWILKGSAHDAELLRLHALEEVFDEHTCRLLREKIGVQVGWRCLELGAGAGSIARWLAERIGSSGSVVAADINCRFLTDVPPNVEVRELDAAVADFGTEEFDLVHHRSVLAFVSGRDEALARLVTSLRPGGWLLSEEALNNEYVVAGDSDDKLLARFFDGLRAILDAAGTDRLFAARLRFALKDLSLADVGHEGSVRIAQGGDQRSDIYWPAVDGLRSQLRTVGRFADDEIDRLRELLRDSNSRWVSATLMSAWGRRPG